MNNTRTLPLETLLALVLSTPSLLAQQAVVDYPDATLTAPEQLFPMYTTPVPVSPVKYQTQCPFDFAGLPSTQRMATRVGIQIAGQVEYSTFEIRLGTTTHTGGLSNTFTTNLPDQRLQVDLSGTTLQGGVDGSGDPINRWVEFDLTYPFVFTPGEAITLDVVASSAQAAAFVFAGSAFDVHPRVYRTDYTGEATGTLVGDSGMKFRVVFEPVGAVKFGAGCAGSGGFVPRIGFTGTAARGGSIDVHLSDALGPAPAFAAVGFSRRDFFGLPLPVALGACDVLTSTNIAFMTATNGIGPGNGTATWTWNVPPGPGTIGQVLYVQWILFDSGTIGDLGLVFSDALAIPAY